MIFFHLKNCLFPYISRQRPVRIPHRAFFPRAFRFRPKRRSFRVFFEQKSAFFTVFTACFCAFIQSSSPVRTEFPLYSVQNSRKSARHFLFVHHAKAPHFSMCIGCKSPPLNKGGPPAKLAEGIPQCSQQNTEYSDACSGRIPSGAARQLPLCPNVINLRPVHLFYAKKRQNKCSW